MSELNLHDLDAVTAEVQRLQEATSELQRAAGEHTVTPAIRDIWAERRELAGKLLSTHPSIPEKPDNDFTLVLQLAGALIKGHPKEQKAIASRIAALQVESVQKWSSVSGR